MSETILIVDDEESVRKTFHDWLSGSGLDVRLLSAADAESALQHANRESIDLAILDWNLGSGSDGLQLLEDLSVFHPDVVAILVTGFAHQATPLDALRLGVRDYFDKNQDLNRDAFLRSVRRQLERIVPAKRLRAFNQSLREFRAAVEKILPLVQTTAALNEPAAAPQVMGGILRFMLRSTGANDGVLIVRSGGQDESVRVFDSVGERIDHDLAPFANSIAASAMTLQEPCIMDLRHDDGRNFVQLQPFERTHRTLLAAPLAVGSDLHIIVELFDNEFSEADKRVAAVAAEFGSEVLRLALSGQQNQRLLFSAVEAALEATRTLALPVPQLEGSTPQLDQPPPAVVLDRLRAGLDSALAPASDPDAALQLAEAIRVLALRHGPPAIKHCITLVRSLRETLDAVTGGT